MLWSRVQVKAAVLSFCLERLFASRASGALALHSVVMASAGPEVCLLQPWLPAGPGAAIVLKHCLRSASKPFSHPHAPRLPHLPAPLCLFSIHVPLGVWLGGDLLGSYKTGCHLEIKTSVTADASPQRLVEALAEISRLR